MATMTAGQFLQKVMQDKGLTISDVSEVTRLSPAAVRRALNDEGQRSRTTIRKLAAGVGLDDEQARKLAQLAGHSPGVMTTGASSLQRELSEQHRYMILLLEAIAGPEIVARVRLELNDATFLPLKPLRNAV